MQDNGNPQEQEDSNAMNSEIFRLKVIQKELEEELSVLYGSENPSDWRGPEHMVVRQYRSSETAGLCFCVIPFHVERIYSRETLSRTVAPRSTPRVLEVNYFAKLGKEPATIGKIVVTGIGW